MKQHNPTYNIPNYQPALYVRAFFVYYFVMSSSPKIAPELASLDHLPVTELEPFQGDLKELTTREYKKLRKSLLDNGIIVPFFVWCNNGRYFTLDGHQRCRVFDHEGWDIDVPVIFISADNEQDAKQKLLVISSQYGKVTQEGWDDFTFDLDDSWIQNTVNFDALPFVFGDFTEEEPEESKDAEPITQTEAEKHQEKWQVKEGDVWKLGNHRIACIDCLDETAVIKFLSDVNADLIWADPPYGINIVAANVSVGGGEAYDIPFGGIKKNGSVGGKREYKQQAHAFAGVDNSGKGVKPAKYAPVIGDETTETAIKSSSMLLNIFPDAIHLWWGGNYYANALPNSPSWIVWDKENTGNFADCELSWSNHQGAARIFRHRWNGMLKASEGGQRRVHPTQKPIALAKWAFEKYGKPNDIIFDPFLGSGISVMAAEELNDGRSVYGCDLAPAYVATTIQRWVDVTGEEPKLVG